MRRGEHGESIVFATCETGGYNIDHYCYRDCDGTFGSKFNGCSYGVNSFAKETNPAANGRVAAAFLIAFCRKRGEHWQRQTG